MSTQIDWNEYIDWDGGTVSERAVKDEGDFVTVSIGLTKNEFEKIHIDLDNGVFISTPVEFELTEYALTTRDHERLLSTLA